MRLVDMDNLSFEIPEGTSEEIKILTEVLQNVVSKFPVVDAKPVIHAHWEQQYRSGLPVPFGLAVCSNCDCFSHRRSDYCPNCGAIMDEQQAESALKERE